MRQRSEKNTKSALTSRSSRRSRIIRHSKESSTIDVNDKANEQAMLSSRGRGGILMKRGYSSPTKSLKKIRFLNIEHKETV